MRINLVLLSLVITGCASFTILPPPNYDEVTLRENKQTLESLPQKERVKIFREGLPLHQKRKVDESSLTSEEKKKLENFYWMILTLFEITMSYDDIIIQELPCAYHRFLPNGTMVLCEYDHNHEKKVIKMLEKPERKLTEFQKDALLNDLGAVFHELCHYVQRVKQRGVTKTLGQYISEMMTGSLDVYKYETWAEAYPTYGNMIISDYLGEVALESFNFYPIREVGILADDDMTAFQLPKGFDKVRSMPELMSAVKESFVAKHHCYVVGGYINMILRMEMTFKEMETFYVKKQNDSSAIFDRCDQVLKKHSLAEIIMHYIKVQKDFFRKFEASK